MIWGYRLIGDDRLFEDDCIWRGKVENGIKEIGVKEIPHEMVSHFGVVVRDENGLSLETERVRGHIVVKGLSTSGRVILRYVTSDVRESDFPPGVRKAVSYRLAALIAGSIANATGSGIGVERAEQLAQSHLLVAMARDANDTQHSRKMDNPIERARR